MARVKLIVVLSLMFLVFSGAKPLKYSAKTSSLVIKGYVFKQGEKIETASVKLFQNNKVVQLTSSKKGKFQFILFSDMEYMVEVSTKGCVTERIQISTKEKTEFAGKYTYEFKVDLMGLSKFKGIDIASLDFPTAVIKYDKEEGEYLHDKTYSQSVKKELKRLKEEAKAK